MKTKFTLSTGRVMELTVSRLPDGDIQTMSGYYEGDGKPSAAEAQEMRDKVDAYMHVLGFCDAEGWQKVQ
jgi:hypothetical protein